MLGTQDFKHWWGWVSYKTKTNWKLIISNLISDCNIKFVLWELSGCVVELEDGSEEVFDGCIMAVHAPDAIRLLGEQATSDERRVLGAFQYFYR